MFIYMLGGWRERVGRVLAERFHSSFSSIPQALSQPFSSLGKKNWLGITIFSMLQTERL